MRILEVSMPTSLGEIISIKQQLDTIREQYDLIKVSFATWVWGEALHTEAPDWEHKKQLLNKYLVDLGKLFFGNPPYLMEADNQPFPYSNMENLPNVLHIAPPKLKLDHLLCKGNSLNVGQYIVLTTKVRQLTRSNFDSIAPQLWTALNQLSIKYKIVVLGERKVEMRKEYEVDRMLNQIYSIYDQIVSNIPKDSLLDLTVPALCETVSDISQIQQDCLIMKEAKCVLTMGIGGNFCMATAAANKVLGYRDDDFYYFDSIYDKEYTDAIVTKNPEHFISRLKEM